MKHLKRFNENENSKNGIFIKEFRRIVNDRKIIDDNDTSYIGDILSEVGDLCNKFGMKQEDLKSIIDSGDDIDGILKDLYDFGYEDGELNKEYTEEDVKNFGLWLGNNIKKLRNKTIDDLFDEWKKL